MLDNKKKLGDSVWKKYKSVSYLAIDFYGLDDIGVAHLAIKISKQLYKNKNQTCVLLDFKDLKASINILLTIRKLSQSHMNFIDKSCAIGVPNSYMPFYNTYKKLVTNSKSIIFKSKQEALENIANN